MRHWSGCFILGLGVCACGGRHGDANQLELAGANSTSSSSGHAGGTVASGSKASFEASSVNGESGSSIGGVGNASIPLVTALVGSSAMSAGSGGTGFGAAGSGGYDSSAGGNRASSGTAGMGTMGTIGTAGNGGCACGSLEQCHDGKRCVAKLVPLPQGFSIDATEVTQGQYQAWLLTDPSTESQTGRCASNRDYLPDPTCLSAFRQCPSPRCATFPQTCVDWCDATAYCDAAGKHLCGSIAGRGGYIDAALMGDVRDSQWYAACSSGGGYQYVYGNSAVNGTCQRYVDPSDSIAEVGQNSACQSPDPAYAGVFDLIGNVGEWENHCRVMAGGTSDWCYVRGSMFGVGATEPTCDGEQKLFPLVGKGSEIGFRCCSD